VYIALLNTICRGECYICSSLYCFGFPGEIASVGNCCSDGVPGVACTQRTHTTDNAADDPERILPSSAASVGVEKTSCDGGER
jgi:hypothetical protein